jgi:hypothetical protein
VSFSIPADSGRYRKSVFHLHIFVGFHVADIEGLELPKCWVMTEKEEEVNIIIPYRISMFTETENAQNVKPPSFGTIGPSCGNNCFGEEFSKRNTEEESRNRDLISREETLIVDKIGIRTVR